ncbi:HAMP domain-containing sensor histidine kinase [Neobacillus ginsengisoli]|uniref:Signal transduction histidine-protein kinase ArlS n=1 Tax=Neobacillus ginsengisoli TaxID=904295 RepID=A0ABT9XQB2_9BACI|nr:HAMP domain-containing histidine kinase [Neobacillus ginsengisoli]MDQ0197724.1 signal transduction histidine kinase [Neobacillus ginsengisoli]
MIQRIRFRVNRFPWQTKLVLSGSTAIFFTFFLFSFLEYHTVSNWMLKREEVAVNRTITDIATYFKDRSSSLTNNDIENSKGFLRKMNDKDQLIRIYDQTGKILVLDKNGDFSVLEPTPVKERITEYVTEEGNEAIVSRLPIKGDKFQGTLEVVRQLNNYNKMMDHLFWVMTVFGIAAILLSAISGFFLANQLLKPVRDLANAMKKIKENGFQERMEVYKQKDELTDLTIVFNEMMDEIEKSFLQQKQFVEDASHELRTPVSILEGHLSLLNRWGKKDPLILDESLEASLQELTRLKKLIIDLLELTRAENPRILIGEKANLPIILRQLVKNLEMIHPDFLFTMDLSHQMPQVAISEQHLQQILIILLDNSIKYSRENKTIVISAKELDNAILLSVMDRGIGIPTEHIPEVFNRFYRIDKARSRENGGTGLGLSIAKRLIEKNNGFISIESKEGVGTKVNIVLPIVADKRKF